METDMKGNGATEVKSTELTVTAAIEVFLEGQAQIQETLDEINTKLDVMQEKLDSLSLDNDGFEVFDEA